MCQAPIQSYVFTELAALEEVTLSISSPYFRVGIENSLPARIPLGQRVVTFLVFV